MIQFALQLRKPLLQGLQLGGKTPVQSGWRHATDRSPGGATRRSATGRRGLGRCPARCRPSGGATGRARSCAPGASPSGRAGHVSPPSDVAAIDVAALWLRLVFCRTQTNSAVLGCRVRVECFAVQSIGLLHTCAPVCDGEVNAKRAESHLSVIFERGRVSRHFPRCR